MRIDGKKWANGEYKLNRYTMYDGSRNIVDTILVKITDTSVVSKESNKADIRTIEFRTTKKALVWFEGSRLGLLYETVGE